MSSPVWVLDTNVVLDLLVFDDAVARPLGAAIEAGEVVCVASDATLRELACVLAYPELALDAVRQAELLARYAAWCRTVAAPPVDQTLPRCRDADDQKFLELAAASGADTLVTKDRALLKLTRRCASRFRILCPPEAATRLAARAVQSAPGN